MVQPCQLWGLQLQVLQLTLKHRLLLLVVVVVGPLLVEDPAGIN